MRLANHRTTVSYQSEQGRTMDTRSFRRTLAGACLILAPALLVVVELIHPNGDDEAAGLLANIAGSTTEQYWAHALALVVIAMLIPAVLGLVHVTRGGRTVLAHLGGALALVGLVALAALVGTEFVLWQAAKNADTAAMTALVDQVMESSGFVPLYIASLGVPIGLLILGTAAYLTQAAPRWAAVLIGIAPVILFANELAIGPKWINVASAVALLLGAGVVGSQLLTESDDEWEAVPATVG